MTASSAILFYVSAGPEFGLGHWRRMQAVASAYQRKGHKGPIDFCLLGCTLNDIQMFDNQIKNSSIYFTSEFDTVIVCDLRVYTTIFFDLHPRHITPAIYRLSHYLISKGAIVIAIDDVAVKSEMAADLRWVPSFFKNPDWPCELDIQCGWEFYLVEKKRDTIPVPQKSKLLILTGGSDVTRLGAIWPQMIEDAISQPLEINWVKGPFSAAPALPQKTKHKFIIHEAPRGLDDLISSCDWVLTVHGISVFEALMYERACIVFNPYSEQKMQEMNAFENENVVFLARSNEQIITSLKQCLDLTHGISSTMPKKTKMIDGKGPCRLIEMVENLRNFNKMEPN